MPLTESYTTKASGLHCHHCRRQISGSGWLRDCDNRPTCESCYSMVTGPKAASEHRRMKRGDMPKSVDFLLACDIAPTTRSNDHLGLMLAPLARELGRMMPHDILPAGYTLRLSLHKERPR